MNIASLLKQEISRVARKEVRAEVQALKKASSSYRAEIAALKRRAVQLERLVGQLRKGARKRTVDAAVIEPTAVVRFSAKGLAAQRRRLGLSAADLGSILGVSGQSVYKWEEGKNRPRAHQLSAIASLRKMGKREAAEKLTELK
ncbi:MAG: helix-turn-helix transcriptional regulator [Burkholderiaceae bacterium]|nr:helix-turn-helix transcriptional regulator [Burkholderiaceae bacterium]